MRCKNCGVKIELTQARMGASFNKYIHIPSYNIYCRNNFGTVLRPITRAEIGYFIDYLEEIERTDSTIL